MMQEFFALIMVTFILALYFMDEPGEPVADAIEEAEKEPSRKKRLQILRKSDNSLDYDHPKLLLKLALATMAVAYEETSWVERLTFSEEARRAAMRGINACIRRRMNPARSKLPHDLRSVYGAAEREMAEAKKYLSPK